MGYSILVVDDSETVRVMVKKGIALSGAEVEVVHEAKNGIEALEKLAKERIDIVFTDLHMPEMDGMELILKMSQKNLLDTIAVVVLSSDRSEKRIDELKKMGVRGYMTKPFLPESFREVLAALTGEAVVW